MIWLRNHRRALARLSALVVVLQSLAFVFAASAHAAAANAEGSSLVVLCTAEGLKVVDLSADELTPVPLAGHQCPLCIAGCGGTCAVSVPAAALIAVAIVFAVSSDQAVPAVAVESPQHRPRLALKSAHPRGPPLSI